MMSDALNKALYAVHTALYEEHGKLYHNNAPYEELIIISGLMRKVLAEMEKIEKEENENA
jgi:hypothetical protein